MAPFETTRTAPLPAQEQRASHSLFTTRWPWLAGAIGVLLLWLLPVVQTAGLQITPAEQLRLQTEIRDMLAKVFWTGITLAGLAVLWRHFYHLATVVENSARTLAAAERNAYFAAQGAASDRYARAMALLADERVEVRLGGIYALERLARESDKEHAPIMEVLAAFVRDQAAWVDGDASPARPAADIQAVLSVLGRRTAAQDPLEMHVDLHGVNLARAYLPWANLERAFLYESNLEGAILQNANLRGAWLWKANLKDATLDGTHLEGADLTGVAGLTAEQFRAAFTDERTKLPEHLRASREAMREGPPPEPEAEDLRLPSLRAVS